MKFRIQATKKGKLPIEIEKRAKGKKVTVRLDRGR